MGIYKQYEQPDVSTIKNRDKSLKAFITESIDESRIHKEWHKSINLNAPLSGLTYGIKDLLHHENTQ